MTGNMTADDFRRLALAFDGAVEGAHMNHPDFRAHGRIFATLHPDGVRGMVKLTPELQKQFMRGSRAFEPASGAWGLQGATMVRLDAIDEEVLGEAMTAAWQLSRQSSAASRRSSVNVAGRESKPASRRSKSSAGPKAKPARRSKRR
jgi:hypothetical protein